MKDVLLKVKVPDDAKLLAIRYTKPHNKRPTVYWTQHYADYVEIQPDDTIRDEMDSDMEESGMAQGEIESCLTHWNNKYLIIRKP